MKKDLLHTVLHSALLFTISLLVVVQCFAVNSYASAQDTDYDFRLDTEEYSTCVGTKYTLFARMNDYSAPAPTIISSDDSVASVSFLRQKEDESGYYYEIIANGIGTATITLTSDTLTHQLNITVNERYPAALDTTNCVLIKGSYYDFLVSTNVNDNSYPTPSTSDASIASVRFLKKVGCGKYLYRVTALQEGIANTGVIVCGKESDFVTTVLSSAQISDSVLLQNPELPVGCEITSLTNVLNFYGYGVSKTYIADLVKKDTTRKVINGRVYMADPNDVFVGNPRVKSHGYGCFAPVITETANNYLSSVQSSKRASNITGSEPVQLYSQLLAGRPVIVWATMEMVAPACNATWHDIHSGENVYWIGKEHCLVLIGVTDSTVTFMDPLIGIESYSRSLFELRYNQLGKQAVIIE